MSEMRERLALILFHHDDGEATPITMGEARELAGQLLTAMREPTGDMIEAGMPGPINDPPRIWRAMIDAALTE